MVSVILRKQIHMNIHFMCTNSKRFPRYSWMYNCKMIDKIYYVRFLIFFFQVTRSDETRELRSISVSHNVSKSLENILRTGILHIGNRRWIPQWNNSDGTSTRNRKHTAYSTFLTTLLQFHHRQSTNASHRFTNLTHWRTAPANKFNGNFARQI